ncbi:capsular polysaccharide export protein, LipB/KpsS family [Mycoplana ramosa]|uniref:Capsular polysaccharide biosynthesis protein n=1 Tax=Mycoplana ramosa TaxID=40837 RepID=A0ABW3YZB0_MYCRA
MVVIIFRVLLVSVFAPYQLVMALFARKLPPKGKPPLFLFGFTPWKTFIHDWFPDRRIIFTSTKMLPVEFNLHWKWRLLRDRRSEVLTWQYQGLPIVKKFCRERDIPFQYVEDGFVRSIKLGALHAPPMSLTFDRQDMYFNAEAPTDLENILSSYNFEADAALIERSRACIARLLHTGISKYNSGAAVDATDLYGPKRSKRILVIGQVERDASIAYGCRQPYTNSQLLKLARDENPAAEIIYKPHPEVLKGIAPNTFSIDEAGASTRVLEKDISLADSFPTIDHVYTITSLSGFEALLRGLKVTTVGCPFYSGWGLTDDRQPNPRRNRRLTIEQLFAGAYILYPRYFDPDTKRYIQLEEALDILALKREQLCNTYSD